MTEKEILGKIDRLSDEDKFHEIVDLIENLDEGERTPSVLCELARAYNNLAVYNRNGGRDCDMLREAIALLESIEDSFPENDYKFNYRMGYALYYLERHGQALERFQAALNGLQSAGQKLRDVLPIEENQAELIDESDDVKDFIDLCIRNLTLPDYDRNFAQRVESGWKKFAAGEEKLRRIISEKWDSDEIVEYCRELLSETFSDCCFELGFNGEKYDLILSPEKDKYMLFPYREFKRRTPESVLENWNIIIGRQPSDESFDLGFDGRKFGFSEVSVRVELDDEGDCTVIGYSEQLTEMLNEDKNKAYWAFDLLLDMALGEIVNMRYVDSVELANQPLDDSVPLTKLRDVIRERFGENKDWDSAESYLNLISAYETKPRELDEGERPIMRFDAFYCFSSLPQLMFEYLNNEHDTINKANNDGVAAGFIFFPTYTFEDDADKKRGEKILDFREELQGYIEENAGESCVFIGGASGANCYLDFLAWDVREVLDAAVDFLNEHDIVPWACYQSFRADVEPITLMQSEEG